jgi:hypothetical protein
MASKSPRSRLLKGPPPKSEKKSPRKAKSPEVARKGGAGEGRRCPIGSEEVLHRGQVLCTTPFESQQKILICNGVSLPAEACIQISGVRKHFTSDWDTYIKNRDKYWTRSELVSAAIAVDLPNSLAYAEKFSFGEAMKGLHRFLGNYVVSSEAPKPPKEVKKSEVEGCRTYFEIRYLNNAWGFRHTGTMIDICGQIFKYDFSSSNGGSKESMNWTTEERLAKAEFTRRLPKKEFEELVELTEEAIQAGFAENWKKTGWANDAGTSTYSIYVMVSKSSYHPKGSVEEFVLAKFGDEQGHVETEESVKLVERMRQLEKSVAEPEAPVPGPCKSGKCNLLAFGTKRSPKGTPKSPRKR